MYRKLFAAIAVLALAISVSSCSSSNASESMSFAGTWTNADDTMSATISDSNIEIFLVGQDAKVLYWKGTFPKLATGDDIVSEADREALDASIAGSQDSTKDFHYEDGKLSFSMSMMGVTKTVELER